MRNKQFIFILGCFIAVLNLFDGLTTNYGIINNLIKEMNPIMNFIIDIHPDLFLLLKVILSIAILLLSYTVYKKSNESFQKPFFYSLIGVSLLYIGISFMHIYWLTYI